jgi:oxygen-independent coproporphyrinogen-3 oxidase
LAGIYLHIPFCRQACTYCNFHFTTSLRYRDGLVRAMVMEVGQQQSYLGDEKVDTIYFGGGTPSLLSIQELELLLDTIRKNYSIAADVELTLEANPDDINTEKLKAWKDAGVNRLSIGVQSFFEEELRWMNRAHNATEARNSLELALREFDNITMDLIYGSPILTDEGWKENVDTATGLGIPHLSCYALTVEEKTPLHKNILSQKSSPVDPDKQARQFLLLMQWLREKGYEHYEVSNFAKPGFRSRHNSAYWKGSTYLGLGPSAHSFNGRERSWNIANNNVYIHQVSQGNMVREKEILSSGQRWNELVMISLRTSEGLDLDRVEKEWGAAARQDAEQQLEKYVRSGHVIIDQSHACLTDNGMLLADGISSELFIVSDIEGS